MTPALKQASNPIGYPKLDSPLQNPVIRVYDNAGNVIETHEHPGGFATSKRGAAE